MISKRALIIIGILLIISPIFGVLLADLVGYHEPLDVAAEMLGLKDITEEINWTPFLDYTIPGIPDTIGYIVAGIIGVGLILIIGYMLSKMVRKA